MTAKIIPKIRIILFHKFPSYIWVSLNRNFTIKTVSSCIKATFHIHTMKFTVVLVCVSYCRPFAGSPADDWSSIWLTMRCHRPETPSKTAKRIITVPLTQPALMAADYKLIPWVAMY